MRLDVREWSDCVEEPCESVWDGELCGEHEGRADPGFSMLASDPAALPDA